MVPFALCGGAQDPSLKRALLLLCLLLVAAAIAFATVPLDRERPAPANALHGRSPTAISAEGPLRAGASKVRIPVGPGAVLAGYPGLRHAQDGGEEVFARAIAIQSGTITLFVASIETLLVPGELEEEVLRRAGLPGDTCLLLAATHTHSGPGGTWNDAIAGWAGNGPFDRAQRDGIAQATADALRGAMKALAPAQLQTAIAQWPSGPARARSDGPIDPTIAALRLRRPDGLPVATAVVYGMHATTRDREDKRISGDWPGETSTLIERSSGAPALVLQGAVGNTTWERSVRKPGVPVAGRAQELLRRARSEAEPTLSCAVSIRDLPRPQASSAVSPLLIRAATNAAGLIAPRAAVQTWLQLGSLQLIGVPGEPVGELALGARPAILVALADGYIGYVETSQRWTAGAGESERTYYGPDLVQSLELRPR